MENDLETLIKERLQTFHVAPPERVWEAIREESRNIGRARTVSFTPLYYAAGLAIFLTAGFFIYTSFFQYQGMEQAASSVGHVTGVDGKGQTAGPPEASPEQTSTSSDPAKVYNHTPVVAGSKQEKRAEEALLTASAENGKKTIILPDGSEVTLNAFSEITYPENFPSGREISLKGEAFFDVVKDTEHPFIVLTENSRTEVVGTSFLIRTAKQYDEIFVLTGKVLFGSKERPEMKPVMLTEGQKASSRDFSIAQLTHKNFLSWKTNQLEFENAPLNEVCESLEEHFRVSVVIASPDIKDCRFTGSFSRPSIENILELLDASSGIDYKLTGDGYILSGKGCK